MLIDVAKGLAKEQFHGVTEINSMVLIYYCIDIIQVNQFDYKNLKMTI